MSKRLYKNILWLVVLLMVVVWAAVILWNTRRNNPYRPGITCSSYYLRNDLLTCPEKYEFNNALQKCVPIDENGCTALAVPSTITAAEFTCTPTRLHKRSRDRPCQAIVDCATDVSTYSAEGMCFKLTENDTFVEVECMQVPGCRYLDMVHVPLELTFNEVGAQHYDTFTCPVSLENNRFVRITKQPCFIGMTCANDNNKTLLSCPYHWQCLDDHEDAAAEILCVPCWYYARCQYMNAYTPVQAIAAALT
uniref:AC150/VP91-like protein n=1 Tax=Melanchra picta nucleopolyhedrovirus TaxID=2975247 RepID=A0AA49CJ78_NPVMC|nr:AC150/VP91-like protein [Melanchra picta nucleopolyhedrovirus]